MQSLELNECIDVTQGTVAYGRFGKGPAVILVHGTPSNAQVWRNVVPRLADAFEVIVYDLCGYGLSTVHEGQDTRLRSQARTLGQLIEHWGVERPHLVGHDFGGATVLGAHLKEGVAASSLTIFDAVVLNPWGTEFSMLVNDNIGVFQSIPNYVHEAMIEAHLKTATYHALRPDVLNMLMAPWRGDAGKRAYLRQVADYDHEFTAQLETLYPTISVPTQIMWAEHDAWVAPDIGRKLHSLIPDSTFELMEDAGHFAMEDIPGRIAARIGSFASDSQFKSDNHVL